MRGLRATLLIALREAGERARSRAFIVSTVVTIALAGGAIALAIVLSGGDDTYRVGLAGDPPEGLAEAVAVVAAANGVEIEPIPYANGAAARQAVADEDIHAAIVGDDTVVVRSAGSSPIEPILAGALAQSRLLERLDDAGLGPSVLADAAEVTIDATEPPNPRGVDEVAQISVILLFMVITIYGQWVLLGALEEKSNKVVELLLSATSVRSLLAGKIIGIGILGLAQMTALVALGLGAVVSADVVDLPQSTVATAIWSVVWFLLGFAFYAALYAAAGSLISRTEDVQVAAMPVALVGIASYLISFAIIVTDPHTTAARFLSFIPTIAPIAFPSRLAAGVPMWELLVGVALTVAGIVVIVRVAARVYAGGLLAGGGRIKMRQAWRAAGELAGR